MTLAAARRILRPWQSWLCRQCLCHASIDYREAVRAEREAMRRGCTQAVARARQAKSRALLESMRGS